MQKCNEPLHPRAREGIRLFNEGRYFEAHEELEAAWRDEKGKIRELYQGVLEAGVTYLHLRRGNLAGAKKVFGRSMRWLRAWPPICRGLHIEQLRRDLEAALAEAMRIEADGPFVVADEFFRPVVWEDAADG